jgi:P protein
VAPRQETPPKETDEHQEEKTDQNPFHKFRKIGCLVAVWVLMVMFLTSTPEKVLERRQLAVPIAEQLIYVFPHLPRGARINATFAGAFVPPKTSIEDKAKNRRAKTEKDLENYIRVYLQSNGTRKQLTIPKLFAVVPPQYFDTTNTTKVPIMFDIGEEGLEELDDDTQGLQGLQLVIESNFTKTPEDKKQEMPLQFVYDDSPINRQIGVIFAAFVLIFLYALIIWEVSMATHKSSAIKFFMSIAKVFHVWERIHDDKFS